MKKDTNIENEVNKTLNSLDNWQKVETDAFFYTRLSAQLENKQNTTTFAWLFDTPILKPALIAVALLINVLSIGYIYYGNQSSMGNDFADAFSTEYMLDQSTESYLVINE
ncbi:MAG: hypothetical protein PF517_13990 [Salinivirgaceae bacterium]|jgi:hypothetical protein|nr:hypothetical protein [Salinivirgaceae bacterium]